MTTQLNELGQPVGAQVPGWQPRATPPMTSLLGRTCSVVALTEAHLADLWSAYADTDDAHWTYLPAERPRSVDEVRLLLPQRSAGYYTYAVMMAGAAQGMLSLLRADAANGVIEVGWIALGSRLKRTVAATEAQRLVMGHVFDDLGYRRLEWKCDALNAPSRAAAERLGYRLEGVFRHHVVTKGRNRDTAWYAVLDSEWPSLRSRLDTWLAPSNFTADGQQRARLGGAA